MASPHRLITPNLKLSQLKYWAFLTGMPITNTKTELLRALREQVNGGISRERSDVLSVDMGIRNLAFCKIRTEENENGLDGRIRVEVWRKMDLIGMIEENMKKKKKNGKAVDDIEEEGEEEHDEIPANENVQRGKLAADAFTPANLSKVATAVTSKLLEYEPSEILIERQRFRSGGAAAIQEWTVRVNMLESMLWACLETRREDAHAQSERENNASSEERVQKAVEFPSTHAVSPARVSSFWTMGTDLPLRPPAGFLQGATQPAFPPAARTRQKAIDIKKAKIDVVKSWVAGDADVQLDFSSREAAESAEFFQTETASKSKSSDRAAIGKLDDLADSLLQAVAWVRWRENAREILRMWREVSRCGDVEGGEFTGGKRG
ncbi:Cruciform cutting endonuclease 1 like [Lecanosticta acicola]|uniref:Cruciform cutting endonuclease 1 like n=1 Tax=Lecanosticta acicola TaxID=111012 RepID=A0AAI8Z012_9PEZI|nr:Cruciform cutting endonuclease 1 like [Lecanosticta acicola]